LLVNIIRRVSFPDVCYRFRPSQSCAFKVSVIRRFFPGVQSVEPLFLLAKFPSRGGFLAAYATGPASQ
jgi:hypothetical protein